MFVEDFADVSARSAHSIASANEKSPVFAYAAGKNGVPAAQFAMTAKRRLLKPSGVAREISRIAFESGAASDGKISPCESAMLAQAKIDCVCAKSDGS